MAKRSVRSALPWLLLGLVVLFVAWKLRTSHFDWAGFAASWRTADFRLIALAIAVLYTNYPLRAMRWAIFLRPALRQPGSKPVHWWTLVGPQFVGFTGLAIFGRIGELIRPLLVSRRTGQPFPSQIAVVAVERIFDLGAFALIFSLNLLLSPSLQSLPHHELFRKVGFATAALTMSIVIFVLLVRLAGTAMAALAGRVLSLVSKKAGETAVEKVLAFREGLNVIDSVPDFLFAAALSILLWGIIAATYVIAMKAFPVPVRNLTVADTLLLMGFSIVGGVVQLPGVGGGAQVGTISALTVLFLVPKELAVSAGLMIWLITAMSVVPAGLLFARIEGVSLRQITRRSEALEEEKDAVRGSRLA